MYDVTNKESFRALRSWLKEAGKYGVSHSNATIAVVGNKIDQYPRVVTENDVSITARCLAPYINVYFIHLLIISALPT